MLPYRFIHILLSTKMTMMSEIRKISKEISSNYADQPRGLSRQINRSILDKYLHEDYPCLDAMERILYSAIPYWNITLPRIKKNFVAVIEGTWQFDYIAQSQPIVPADKGVTASIIRQMNDDSLIGKNISMYFVFWLPLTAMLLAHLLHNQPNQESHFGVAGTGAVMLGFMLFVAYALYVYANMVASPFNLFLQHLCPASYISAVDFIFAVICAASPAIVLIPITILYACAATGLHFRLYNQMLKPTLFEMVGLFLIIAVLKISAAYLYYLNFSWFWSHKKSQSTPIHAFLLRNFDNM